MGKRISLSKKEKNILVLVVILHAMLLYVISSYSKAMETYADELIYYDMAKSIFEGTGLQLHGVKLPFSKLGYSFVLLPTFLINDVTARVKVIMLINSILMSAPIPITYLICRELNVKRSCLLTAVMLMAIWPDVVISGTFMSENLFFPLCCLCFYFVLLSYKYKKISYVIAVIILSLLTYFTKEIGICVLLSYVAAEFIFSIKKRDLSIKTQKKKIPAKTVLQNRNIAIFIISACVILIVIFFGGFSNTYIESGALDFSYLTDYKMILYLLYALLYYLVAVTLSFYVLPVLMPVLNHKKLSKEAAKFLLYTVLLYLGSILVIVMTITVKEDYGKLIPAVHLRYLSQLALPFICIFFAGLPNDDKLENRDLKVFVPLMLMAGLIFKGVYSTCTTGNVALLYIYPLRKIVPDTELAAAKVMGLAAAEVKELAFSGVTKPAVAELNTIRMILKNVKIIYNSGAVTAAIFLIMLLLFYHLYNKNKSHAIRLFTIFASLLSAINIAMGLRNVHATYHVDGGLIAEMTEIDKYFKENHLENSNVAFVTDNQFSKEAKVYDLYFRSADKEYMIKREDLERALDGEQITEPVWGTTYTPEKIDYIILPGYIQESNEESLNIPASFCHEKISGNNYAVYKNTD